jgi:tetratricopeptide (TPR) repeat protein
MIEGFNAYVNGDAATAIEIGHEILSHYPDDKEMYFTLGFIYRYGLRQLDSAVHYYGKTLELDSLHEATYNALAYCHNDIGDFGKSIWAINKYIELAPNQANPYDSRGELYASGGEIDKAIESFQQAVDIKPDFYPSWESLGHMYVFKRDYDEAARCYEKLLESPSRAERSDGRAGLARIPVYQGRFADALELMQQVIATDRMEKAENWEKLGEVARIHIERDNVEKTLEAIWEASADFLKNRGRVLPFYHITVEVLADAGRLIEAEDSLEVWRSAIEQHDTTYMPFYYIGAGIVARAKGDYETALGYFTQAIEEFADRDSPYGFRSRLQLAHTYKDVGNLGEAIALYEQLLANYGEGRIKWTIESVKLHYYLAIAYEESGWNNKAIEQYETFLEIWSQADEGLKSVDDAEKRLASLQKRI